MSRMDFTDTSLGYRNVWDVYLDGNKIETAHVYTVVPGRWGSVKYWRPTKGTVTENGRVECIHKLTGEVLHDSFD